MHTIDLNCDMGEGIENDAELMKYITSVNIACGYHAGDVALMKHTINLAKQNGVAIGAHPGFADKPNFGRTEMHLSPEALYILVADQVVALRSLCVEAKVTLHHVKPHGALYNMAAKDQQMARTIARAVFDTDSRLVLYGLSGSNLITEAAAIGLITAAEVFADRTYQNDGSLTPRNQPNAMINSVQQSVNQVLQMIQQQTVLSVDKKLISIKADTICLHGDGEHAVSFAKAINKQLTGHQIEIRSI